MSEITIESVAAALDGREYGDEVLPGEEEGIVSTQSHWVVTTRRGKKDPRVEEWNPLCRDVEMTGVGVGARIKVRPKYGRYHSRAEAERALAYYIAEINPR